MRKTQKATETNDMHSFIPASQNLPEITLKAILLAIVLAIVLAAANAYLGLKVGITVSASIPAAVVSMGVLRLFRNSNILENNIVQTAASTGEALVGGLIFVLPAMLIIKYWANFNYWETVFIGITGGLLGVIFSVPLRRVLLSQPVLKFPEGTAIGHVLKASVEGKSGLKLLTQGGLVGGFISLCQNGFEIITSSLQLWFKAGNTFVYGLGSGFNPAIIAAGYIVGINIGLSALLGIIVGWLIGVPVLTYLHGVPAMGANNIAMSIWQNDIRYIGVGTFLVGGFWTLITLIKPISDGLRTSYTSVANLKNSGFSATPRTERDMPIKYVLWSMVILFIPLLLLVQKYTGNSILQLSIGMQLVIIGIALCYTIVVGFALCAVGGYFAGLIGSSNSPGSALMLSGLLIFSLILLALLGHNFHFATDATQRLAAAALAIVVTSVIGAATLVTNETIQDLKAGQIVGATPWKQQVMLIVGVIASALIIPLILQLLFEAYGIGGVFPRPGMDPTRMLAAPQAGMMATLAQGVFTWSLPWAMMTIGIIIGVITLMIDKYLHDKGYSITLPVLGVGTGIYLPLDASVPMVIGGLASYFIESALARRHAANTPAFKQGKQRSLILACGMVAGAALMGVILAIPFAISQSTDVLKIVSDGFTPIADVLAFITVIGLIYWFYYAAVRAKN